MKDIEVIIILPLVVLSLLLLMAVDLVRMTQGKQTVGEEWHDDYGDGNMNHGQGRINND